MCGETSEKVISRVNSQNLLRENTKESMTYVTRMVHWKLCEKFKLEKSEKYYLRSPQTVSENIYHKLIWDMNIQCDNVIVERRPDIVIVDKTEKTAIIIDAAIPGDRRIIDKEKEKTE